MIYIRLVSLEGNTSSLWVWFLPGVDFILGFYKGYLQVIKGIKQLEIDTFWSDATKWAFKYLQKLPLL